jgi:hypothetical protein
MILESRVNKANEARIAERLSHAWGLHLEAAPECARFDYAALDRFTVTAFVEAKQSQHASGKYATFMVDLHKAIYARAIHQTCGIPAILAVQFTDALLVYPGFIICAGVKLIICDRGAATGPMRQTGKPWS